MVSFSGLSAFELKIEVNEIIDGRYEAFLTQLSSFDLFRVIVGLAV